MGKEPPPAGMRSSDFFEDTEHSTPVELDAVETGDIIGLQYAHRQTLWATHVTLAWQRESGLYVVHNALYTGRLTVQPLEEARKHPAHERIAGIKRLRDNPANRDPMKLIQMGLGQLLSHAA